MTSAHARWLRRGLIGLAASLLVPLSITPLHAQRFGFGGGCSWDPGAINANGREAYWTNPFMHNESYDGHVLIARIWYAGYYAYCAASAPYGNEFSVGWAHDFPHPEENLAKMVNGLSTAKTHVAANILRFDDPELSRFPIAYLTEPGGWVPNAKEAAAARNYLLKGGFLIVDDWRGPSATSNALAAFKKIFPELRPIDVPESHALFNSFFQIKNATRLLRNQNRGYGGEAAYWGYFENNDPTGRLMVICDVNEDIKDYWVWSSTGRDAIDVSNEAYKLGINYIMYSLTH